MSKPPNPWEDDPVYVDPEVIRQKFNEAQVWERAQRGEILTLVWSEHHPAKPLAQEPFCTKSQMIAYYTRKRVPVALAHQYLRPDGTLGASGRPDPVRFYDGATLLAKKIRSP